MTNASRRSLSAAVLAACVVVFAPAAPMVQRPAPKPATKPIAFPLKLSENKRYLVDQNGTPFFIVGDSPQGIMGRLTEKEAAAYFADRQARGFNTIGWIDVVCAGHDYPTNIYGETPDGIRPFTAFLSGGSDYAYYDLSKPNEAYFVRLDHMLQFATKRNFLIFVDPIETIGWLPTLRRNGVQAAYAYGQFLGRRYGGYTNLIWLDGNDFRTWHEGQDGALLAAAKNGIRSFFHAWHLRNDDALVQAVSRGIKSAAPQQLQTLELEPETSSSFDDPAWRSLIDLNGTYTYFPAYLQTLHSYNQLPTAPTWLMESRYEFDQGDIPPDPGVPYILRKEEYWAMMAGATGQFYANAYVWPFKDGWQGKLDTVGVRQVGYWKDFFLSIPWQELIPDQRGAVLNSGAGAACDFNTSIAQCDRAVAARSPDGSMAVIYLPTPRTIKVNMSVLSRAAHAIWFDPSNGSYRTIDSNVLLNAGVQEFVPLGRNHAGEGDWVLLLEVRSLITFGQSDVAAHSRRNAAFMYTAPLPRSIPGRIAGSLPGFRSADPATEMYKVLPDFHRCADL